MPAPNLAACKTYLGSEHSWTDPQITEALVAEKAAQANACKVPLDSEAWPWDLAEALKRRVLRNLTMRSLPLGLQTSMSEMAVATTRVGSDPEVRRLEAPYRRLVVG